MKNGRIKVHTRMGGGAMNKPMGYSKGMSIKDDDKRDIRKTESMIGASKSSKREKKIMNKAKTGKLIGKQKNLPKHLQEKILA